ncbi:hypothetical protein HKX69_05690 [Streptomyces argyrophyllae]|uniref:Uncharacterized protein n=1 Tax=Streptomyces argyrophylli TaxID=2726118 RepID=A0A6M4PDC7_9ACTN|nr:hypothetical protein [Streptomyces argyrophyllae]QJS09075.1 hypothetical protein HKX69_05690 [Streptomyces argyrophyllae]
MTYPNPFDERSPWDEKPETPDNKESKPLTTAAEPTPENVTLSIKGGPGYEASLLVVRAGSPEELDTLLAERAGVFKSIMDRAAKMQAYSVEINAPAKSGSAPKRFSGGKVERKDSPPQTAGDDCPHGRSLVSKANWSALFCDGPDGDKCEPLWKQKDGSFKANK